MISVLIIVVLLLLAIITPCVNEAKDYNYLGSLYYNNIKVRNNDIVNYKSIPN